MGTAKHRYSTTVSRENIMPIVQRESARNLSELAQRLYGLGAQDTRIAAAVRALTAANPGLPGDLSAMLPTTPIVAPTVSGLAVAPQAAGAMPQDIDVLSLARYVAEASKKIMTAAQSGSPPAQDPTRDEMLQRLAEAQPALKLAPSIPQQVDPQKLANQLQMLTDNIAAFLKRHAGS
jgi:hypothetical protein